MTRIIGLLAFAIFASLTISCHQTSKYYDYRLKLENKTGKTIMAYNSYNYPDTSLDPTIPKGIEANNLITGPNGEITFVRGGTWETAFKDDIPSGKMMIFVLDKDQVDHQPWDSIRQNYAVLKRFDLTLDSLRAHNFKITLE